MARTVDSINENIRTEKDAQTELDVLTSTSPVAIWRLLFYVFAKAVYTLETLWDGFKADMELIKSQALPGTAAWLQVQALKFQYGDPLIVQNNTYQYETIDETKKIIKHCSISDGFDNVIVKVAKDANSLPVPLSDEELSAFRFYATYYKRFAGVAMSVISQSADLVKLQYTIYFDAMYTLTTVKSNISIAITNYFATMPFDGILKLSALEDAIQSAEGVVDFTRNTAQTKPSGGDYSTIVRRSKAVSGYFQIDPDFSTNDFNYLPND